MLDTGKTLAILAVIALITAAFRFTPFLIFRREIPGPVRFLGKVLPPAVMGMLIVYCLKDTRFLEPPYGIPELLSILLVILVHKWKRNTLLSVAGGVLCYMTLVQFVFK